MSAPPRSELPPAPVFLDTNVILRHLLGDHPQQSPAATAWLARVEAGEVRARTSELVVFEAVFTLHRTYRVGRAAVRDNLFALLDLRGVLLPGKRALRTAADLWVELNISFADAYHVGLMRREGITEVVSFDHEFDRVADIRRVSPGTTS